MKTFTPEIYAKHFTFNKQADHNKANGIIIKALKKAGELLTKNPVEPLFKLSETPQAPYLMEELPDTWPTFKTPADVHKCSCCKATFMHFKHINYGNISGVTPDFMGGVICLNCLFSNYPGLIFNLATKYDETMKEGNSSILGYPAVFQSFKNKATQSVINKNVAKLFKTAALITLSEAEKMEDATIKAPIFDSFKPFNEDSVKNWAYNLYGASLRFLDHDTFNKAFKSGVDIESGFYIKTKDDEVFGFILNNIKTEIPKPNTNPAEENEENQEPTEGEKEKEPEETITVSKSPTAYKAYERFAKYTTDSHNYSAWIFSPAFIYPLYKFTQY